MEPVAHSGLGALKAVDRVEVRWPGGEVAYIEAPEVRRTIEVAHPAGWDRKSEEQVPL
jgi:hypothetical protein